MFVLSSGLLRLIVGAQLGRVADAVVFEVKFCRPQFDLAYDGLLHSTIALPSLLSARPISVMYAVIIKADLPPKKPPTNLT